MAFGVNYPPRVHDPLAYQWGEDRPPLSPLSRRCNKCGATGLDWMQTSNDPEAAEQWRLIDAAGQLHNCHGKPATAEDFK